MRLFAAILEHVCGNKKPNKKKKHEFTSVVIKFNKDGVVHKNHPFKDREFDGAFKECGCLPDCGCKETKEDNMKGWLP